MVTFSPHLAHKDVHAALDVQQARAVLQRLDNVEARVCLCCVGT